MYAANLDALSWCRPLAGATDVLGSPSDVGAARPVGGMGTVTAAGSARLCSRCIRSALWDAAARRSMRTTTHSTGGRSSFEDSILTIRKTVGDCALNATAGRRQGINPEAGTLAFTERNRGWGWTPSRSGAPDRRGGAFLVCQVQKVAEGDDDRQRVTGHCGGTGHLVTR